MRRRRVGRDGRVLHGWTRREHRQVIRERSRRGRTVDRDRPGRLRRWSVERERDRPLGRRSTPCRSMLLRRRPVRGREDGNSRGRERRIESVALHPTGSARPPIQHARTQSIARRTRARTPPPASLWLPGDKTEVELTSDGDGWTGERFARRGGKRVDGRRRGRG